MLAMLSTVDDVGWCERWFEERPEGWNDEISNMVTNCQVKFHRHVREKIMLCSSYLRHDMSTLLTYVGCSFRDRLIHRPTPTPLTWPAMASSQVDGRLSSERSWTASGNLRAKHRSQGILCLGVNWGQLTKHGKLGTKDRELGTMGPPQTTKMDRIVGVLMDSGFFKCVICKLKTGITMTHEQW